MEYKNVFDLVVEHLVDGEMVRESIFTVLEYRYKIGYELLKVLSLSEDGYIIDRELECATIIKKMRLNISVDKNGNTFEKNSHSKSNKGRKSRRRR